MALFRQGDGSDGSTSGSSSYYTVHTGEEFAPSETSLVDADFSEDGSSVLDESFGSTHSSEWSSHSGFLENASMSSRTSSVLTSNSSSYMNASVSSIGSNTIMLEDVPTGAALHKLLHMIYKRYHPSKREEIETIMKHFDGREAVLLHALGEKYGFKVKFADKATSTDDDASSAMSDGTRLSQYYDGNHSITESIEANSGKLYHRDEMAVGMKIQRYIIYPKLTLTIAIESTRTMHCYIVVKKQVNGAWYEVKRTNTALCKPNKCTSFVKSIDVLYHVGIDDQQTLLFEVMDGDMLFVGSGYYFGCSKVQISDLQQVKYSQHVVSRADRADMEVTELCRIHVQTELDTEGQRLTLNTTDPLKMGFYRQMPPTLEDMRQAVPSFTEIFGTYLFNIHTKGFFTEHTVDPAVLSRDNTQFYLKFLLNDLDGHYNDTETDVNALECIWQSSKVMDTGKKGSPKYNIFCPITKVEHSTITGDRRLDVPVDPNRKVLVHLYAEGLTTKDGKTGPRLVAYTSISAEDLIEEAVATATGPEEGEVSAKMLKKRNKKHEVRLHFQQVDVLTSSKYQQEKAAKEAAMNGGDGDDEDGEGRERTSSFSRMRHRMSTLDKNFLQLGQAAEEHEYDSLEEDMQDLVKKPVSKLEEDEAVDTKGPRRAAFRKKKRMSFSLRLASRASGGFKEEEEAPEEHLHGEIIIRVARVEVPVITKTGDEVYEEKLTKKFKEVKKKWIKDNSVNFQEACDAQNSLTMRSTIDAEFQLDYHEALGLKSSIVVDMNAPCTQHVLAKATNSGMAGGVDSYSLSGNYTMDCLHVVKNQIDAFAKSEKSRVFAGGGVNPPGKSHPSRYFSRAQAFPLVQELLLSTEEAAAAAERISTPALPLIGSFTFADPREEILTATKHKCDPRSDLKAHMDLQDPLGGLAKKYASWRGYNYNQEQSYTTAEDVRVAFLEASTLYEPSILRQSALNKHLLQAPHLTEGENDPDPSVSEASIAESDNSSELRANQKRMVNADRQKQGWKIKFQAANVGTRQDMESSDVLFYGDIPMKMQHSQVESLDVSALEILIHKSQDNRETPKVEQYDENGQMIVNPTVNPAATPHHQLQKNAIVWVVGSCPSHHVLKRAKRLFQDQLMNPHLPLLCVCVVAETRFDLPQSTAAALKVTADPFGPLLEVFDKAVATARHKLLGRRARRKVKMGDSYKATYQDSLLEYVLSREALNRSREHKSGIPTPTLATHPSHNLCLVRYLTWSEVVAGAFIEEDKQNALYGDDEEVLADDEDEERNVRLPKCSTLNAMMAPFLPSWSAQTVIKRMDIDAADVDEDDDQGVEEEEEKGEEEQQEQQEDANPDGQEDKSDISGITSHSAGSDNDAATPAPAVNGTADGHVKKKKEKENRFSLKGVASGFSKLRAKSSGLVHMIVGRKAKNRNIAAPTTTTSDRVSGFEELTEMKNRFEVEMRSAFKKELHLVLGRYVQTMDTKAHREHASKRRPYNSDMREFYDAAAGDQVGKYTRADRDKFAKENDQGPTEEAATAGTEDGCSIM